MKFIVFESGKGLTRNPIDPVTNEMLVPPAAVEPVAPLVLHEPTTAELVGNFAIAMGRWIKAGFPVLTEEQYQQRSRICDACEMWDASARLGLGKCKAPGCGCTSIKRWLKTEQCKHPDGSKWPAL